jgi:hypothetical protein
MVVACQIYNPRFLNNCLKYGVQQYKWYSTHKIIRIFPHQSSKAISSTGWTLCVLWGEFCKRKTWEGRMYSVIKEP